SLRKFETVQTTSKNYIELITFITEALYEKKAKTNEKTTKKIEE
ncbi:16679_t:CDS:1, partial [Gigaspora margarita]